MAKPPEYWIDLPGTDKYQVSNYGQLRRKLKSGKLKPIKPYVKKNKWMAAKIEFKGIYKEYHVHQIMAEIFLDKPNTGEVLHHKNGMIRDNYAGNLGWITRERLGKKTGANSRSIPILQIDPKTDEVINFYKSISDAARDNYIHKETICLAIRGKLKTAAGWKWRKELIEDDL